MEIDAALRTNVRATIVGLRMQALTLTALVQKSLLEPAEAAAIVREAGASLAANSNDPELQAIYSESIEQIAQNLQKLPHE